MSTTSKGNRAEQELCRKLREFGFKVTKARMSKGPWDRVAEGGDTWAMLQWVDAVKFVSLPGVPCEAQNRWYFDITTNATRGRVKKLLTTETDKPGVKALAVRYDGKSGKPVRWRFWIAG